MPGQINLVHNGELERLLKTYRRLSNVLVKKIIWLVAKESAKALNFVYILSSYISD